MTPLLQYPVPHRRLSRAVLPLAVLAVFVWLAVAPGGILRAQTTEPASPESTYDEGEAQTIDRMLMCPVCPAQTIAQAQVEISKQMQVIVREMLAEGNERDDILDFFIERYGKDILAFPPKSGANLVAWLLPVGGVGTALVAVFFIIRSMARRGPALEAPQPVQDDALAPYLQMVDRHLAVTSGGSASNRPDASVESSGTDLPGPDERS